MTHPSIIEFSSKLQNIFSISVRIISYAKPVKISQIDFTQYYLSEFFRWGLKYNVSIAVSYGLPQVSLVYAGIEMIQPGKSFLNPLRKAGGYSSRNVGFQLTTKKKWTTVRKITTKIIYTIFWTTSSYIYIYIYINQAAMTPFIAVPRDISLYCVVTAIEVDARKCWVSIGFFFVTAWL